jgi:hypothetical protein
MTNLDRLKTLDEEATPGEWAAEGRWLKSGLPEAMFAVRAVEDAALIAEVRNLLPKMIAVIEAARVVLAEWDELGPTGTQSTLDSHRRLRAALADMEGTR